MKPQLQKLITQALEQLKRNDQLPADIDPDVQIERTRDTSHGDYACNIALMLAKPAKRNPRELAEQILAVLPKDEIVAKAEIAGPGFINFFLRLLGYLNHS